MDNMNTTTTAAPRPVQTPALFEVAHPATSALALMGRTGALGQTVVAGFGPAGPSAFVVPTSVTAAMRPIVTLLNRRDDTLQIGTVPVNTVPVNTVPVDTHLVNTHRNYDNWNAAKQGSPPRGAPR